MLGIYSSGIWHIPHLSSFLGVEAKRMRRFSKNFDGLTAIGGWGCRPNTKRARIIAACHNLPFIAIEDGFLRSVGLGVHGTAPLSLVFDKHGIYYDATAPSGLESLISDLSMTATLQSDASRAMQLICRHRLSKYNHAPEAELPTRRTPATTRVLVIDQTAGDVSVRLGGADENTFEAMLTAALVENPDAEIFIKVHPDVVSGKKKGYLGQLRLDLRIQLLAEDVSPLALLEQVDKVYVVTSQMGFEALMLRKQVVCFGQPWYAGWGQTDDRNAGMQTLKMRRHIERSVEELFAAAYLQYAKYIDPVTGRAGTIFDVIDYLVKNKSVYEATRGALFCVGMSLWKRAIARPFLLSSLNKVYFLPSAKALEKRVLPTDAKVVIWGVQNELAVQAVAIRKETPVWRMEDGFMRSVGLGSDLHRPVSLVLDRGGMYYDPASGSDLENMLATQLLSEEDLQRAARFRQEYVSMRASKYNIAGKPVHLNADGRRVLLVPGQVEDDASIQRGSPTITSNLALLRTVRAKNPEAFIVYKPHPDVVAGNRLGAIEQSMLDDLADKCIVDVNIIDCIAVADEVHTMTSLSGFEALMHGRIVHCYGGPFYAGWGLTVDHFPLPHRQRRISLEELVFAAMLKYPRYALPGVSGLASAEQVLAMLAAQASAPGDRLHLTGLRGWMNRKVRKIKAVSQLLRGAKGAGAA